MSRVQKGGAIFKPVAKARARPTPGTASRQASILLDAPAEPVAMGLMGPPVSQSSSHASQPSSTTGTSSSPTRLETPALASRETFQEPPAGPSVVPTVRSEQTPPFLAPSTSPPKTTQVNTGSLISAPSRSSAPSIAVGIPPPSQRPFIYPLDTSNTSLKLLSPLPIAASSTSASQNPLTSEPENTPQLPDGKGEPRKRRRSTTTPDDDDASSTSSKAKGGRGRRSRAPSLPPYDPDADPGDDLDPTVVTMASLCSDTGQGRVSSKAVEILNNHAVWKKQNREKRARMRELMEARKYGRTEQEAELLGETDAIPTPPPITPSTSNASTSGNADNSSPDFDYSQDLATSRYNVQVRIGPNGETVIDEDSLVVNREESDETANYTHVTESDTSKFVNSGTYAKRFRGSRWSAEETEMFFDALMQHGENYELIAYMLPGRDRKSCKNKFKVEDKRNPARINYCLNNRTTPDIAYLSLMTGKDFSGPTPEIRAPSRPPIIPDAVPEHSENEHPAPAPKKRRTNAARDEGLVVVGDLVDSDW